MSFNVFDVAQKDAERQAEIDAAWPANVDSNVANFVGQLVMKGESAQDAMAQATGRRAEIEAAKPNAYIVDGAILYPTMISHIRKVLAGEEELPSTGVALYRSRAKALHEEDSDAFEMALTPRSAFDDDDPSLKARAEALELCRLWFTRLLKEKVGYLYLRITDQTGNKDFKL